jgi:archaellum component FlaC
MSQKIADEMHNLGLEIGKLVDELQNAKQSQSNNQELNDIYLHAHQIKDKYNTLASDLVEFSKNQS